MNANERKRLLRVATAISEGLRIRESPQSKTAHLPDYEWDRCKALTRRLNKATCRGWEFAADHGGDQLSMPAKNSVRSEQGSDTIQQLSAQDISFHCQSSPPVIVEQDSFLAKLLLQNLVLGSEIFNHFLLLAVDPARKEHDHQVPRLKNKIHWRLGDRAKP